MFNAIGSWISNLLGGGNSRKAATPSVNRDDEEERRRRAAEAAALKAGQQKVQQQNQTLPEFAKPKNQPQAKAALPQYRAVESPTAPLKTVSNPALQNDRLVKHFRDNPQQAQRVAVANRVAERNNALNKMDEWDVFASSGTKAIGEASQGLMSIPGAIADLGGMSRDAGFKFGHWLRGDTENLDARLTEYNAKNPMGGEHWYDNPIYNSLKALQGSIETTAPYKVAEAVGEEATRRRDEAMYRIIRRGGTISEPLKVSSALAEGALSFLDPVELIAPLGVGAKLGRLTKANRAAREAELVAREAGATSEVATRRVAEQAERSIAEIDQAAPQIIEQVEKNAGKIDDGISSPTRGKPAAEQAAEQLRLQQQQLAEQARLARQAQAIKEAEQGAQSLAPYVQPEQLDNGLTQLTPDPVMLRRTPTPVDEVQLQEAAPLEPAATSPKPEAASIESPGTTKAKAAAQTTPASPDIVPGTNLTKAELQGRARVIFESGNADTIQDAMRQAVKMAKAQKEAAGGAKAVERVVEKAVEKTPTTTEKSILKGGDGTPTRKEVQDALKEAKGRQEKKPLNRLLHAIDRGDERHLANVMADIKGTPKPEKAPAIANPTRTMERQDRKLGKAIDLSLIHI